MSNKTFALANVACPQSPISFVGVNHRRPKRRPVQFNFIKCQKEF